MFVENYIEKSTNEKSLKDYFNANKEKFSDEQVRASHILFKEENKKEAESVLKEALKPSTDFAALAKKHSTGPSASKGGDLNFFGRGRMVAAFDQVAFTTPVKTVHPKLVKTKFGYHIIKVTDKKGGAKIDYTKKKPQVERHLKKELRSNLIQRLRKDAKVDVNNKVLEELKM